MELRENAMHVRKRNSLNFNSNLFLHAYNNIQAISAAVSAQKLVTRFRNVILNMSFAAGKEIQHWIALST